MPENKWSFYYQEKMSSLQKADGLEYGILWGLGPPQPWHKIMLFVFKELSRRQADCISISVLPSTVPDAVILSWQQD